MATIRKMGKNWQRLVRVKHHPELSKSFSKHEDAKRWGNETELDLRKRVDPDMLKGVGYLMGSIPEDFKK